MTKTITMDNFVKKLEKGNINVIDVREKVEYKLGGHVPGAKNLPLSKIQKKYTELSKDDSYYLICQSGGRSGQAAEFLSDAGYNVTNVQGGMSMWSGKKER